MMRTLVYIMTFCLSFTWVYAQDSRTLIAEDVWSTVIDPLHQVYYTNKQKQAIKLSSIQDREYIYSDLMLDDHAVILAQNAFKSAIYNRNTGDFVMLDNRFSPTGKTNFFDLGYFGITAAAVSTDNKTIWIFDEDMQRLVQLDHQFKEIHRSNNLTQSLQRSIKPSQIVEKTNKIYLLDYKTGLYIFDNLGNYIKMYPIEQAHKVWVISERIYFFRAGQIWVYDSLLFEESALYALPEYSEVDLCKEFILGITPQGKLYQLPWRE